jgi:hypothetical protein
MSATSDYALSLKQPWATLLAHGLKTIEVRRWPTARRGRVLIHAARIPDERPEAWQRVPDSLKADAQRHLGGIIGSAEIVACRAYRDLAGFLADQDKHLNEPGWYEPAGLYGFTFAHAEILAFRKYPGWMRFFPVEAGPFVPRRKPATP